MFGSIFQDFKTQLKSGNMINKLIIINAIVWIVIILARVLLGGIFGGAEVVDFFENWLALPLNPGQLIFRPWTLFTSMFLHFGFFHILFNMLYIGIVEKSSL